MSITPTSITTSAITCTGGIAASSISAGSYSAASVSATNISATGSLNVTGTSTLTGNVSAGGNVSATSGTVTGLAIASNSTLGVSGTSTLSGSVQCTKASGTSLAVTNDVTVGGNVTGSGNVSTSGNITSTAGSITAGSGGTYSLNASVRTYDPVNTGNYFQAQNVSTGTGSGAGALFGVNGTNLFIYQLSNDDIVVRSATPTNYVRIRGSYLTVRPDSSTADGTFASGTSIGSFNNGSGTNYIHLQNSTSGTASSSGALLGLSGSNLNINNQSSGRTSLYTGGLEALRVDSNQAINALAGILVNTKVITGAGANYNANSMIALDGPTTDACIQFRGVSSTAGNQFLVGTTGSGINAQIYNNENGYIRFGVNGSEAMRIEPTIRQVLINATSVLSTHKLQVSGTAYLSSGTAWTTSDARVKLNQTESDYAKHYENVKALKMKKWDWHPEWEKNACAKRGEGWIAQEVHELMDDDEEMQYVKFGRREDMDMDDFADMNPDGVNRAMYGAIKVLIAKVEKLETMLHNLCS